MKNFKNNDKTLKTMIKGKLINLRFIIYNRFPFIKILRLTSSPYGKKS
jgi:hypothetical protein